MSGVVGVEIPEGEVDLTVGCDVQSIFVQVSKTSNTVNTLLATLNGPDQVPAQTKATAKALLKALADDKATVGVARINSSAK